MVATAKETGRNIADTLKDLDIDEDSSPEDAAHDAAAEVASSTEVDEEDGEGEDEEDGEGEDEEDEEDGASRPPSGRVVIPAPKGAALPEAPPPFIPAPKPVRPRGKAGAGGKGMPKDLTEKAPGAAKVKVFKRDKGQRWFIAEYGADDLRGFSDFESFLTRYVMDDYGAGEYDLVGIDAGNREMEMGTIRLRGKPERKESSGAMELVGGLLERAERQNATYLAQMRELLKPQSASNPLDMLTGVMSVQEQLIGKADAKAREAKAEVGDAMSALAASGDRTMQMMMTMMQGQAAAAQQQQQMLLAVLSKPKEEDPVMKLLLMKLIDDKESSGGSGGAPLPPPKRESVAELITALGTFMSSMGGGGGGGEHDDDFKDFLKQMLLKQDNNSFSMKDVVELMSRKEEKPNLKSAIDDLAAVMNVANNLNRAQEGGPAAGLFDALAALFSNRDFAGSIANTIRAKIGQGEAQQRTMLEAERQRLALQQRMTVRTAQMAAGVPMMQVPAQQGVPTYVVTPSPQQVPYAVQQRGPQVVQQGPYAVPQPGMYGPPGPPNAGLTQQEVQQAVDRTLERTGVLPQLPALTSDHINSLATAADDGELVGKTVQMLIYFAEFEDWRPFSEQLLGFVREGNKRATLDYLTAFFDGLAQIHLIEPSLAKKVVRTLIAHFDVVKAQMTDLPLDGDGEITGDDLMASSNAADPTKKDGGTT